MKVRFFRIGFFDEEGKYKLMQVSAFGGNGLNPNLKLTIGEDRTPLAVGIYYPTGDKPLSFHHERDATPEEKAQVLEYLRQVFADTDKRFAYEKGLTERLDETKEVSDAGTDSEGR